MKTQFIHADILSLLIVVALSASFRASAGAQTSPLRSADSVVLERTLCFGICPAYRLSVTKAGQVSFESRNPTDSTTASDSIDVISFERIMGKAQEIEFLKLPDLISDNPLFCPTKWTDHPTATITIFMKAGVKAVEDYHGCKWAPEGLREFEREIDQVARSSRWVKPASRRRPPSTR
ncbi:MAG TPA: DUF6438 domain-containing protein [Gemmatimonadaceae bacterium]|nr:DUF6438 domain-containing protein [Gemmatimonadaceae bacterium]